MSDDTTITVFNGEGKLLQIGIYTKLAIWLYKCVLFKKIVQPFGILHI